MKDVMTTAQALVKAVDNLVFDSTHLLGQEIDREKVQWYTDRFKMLIDDGVPLAIDAYISKAKREDINEITFLEILHQSMNCQLQQKKKENK